MAQLRTLVVIPTYNEAESIARTITTLLETVPAVSVLVVDDASPDGTGDLVEGLATSDPRIAILHRAGREGLGQAYLAGFRHALAAPAGYDTTAFDAIVEMDADGSHPASALPAILAALDTHDLVIGSRWTAGGSVANWPRHREWLSRAANTYARLALRIPVRDSTAGYRAFRASTLRRIDLSRVESRGYCFQIDMTLRVIDAGLSVAEVPITFTDRVAGYSKMSGSIVVEAMVRVTVWGIQRLFRSRSRTPLPLEGSTNSGTHPAD